MKICPTCKETYKDEDLNFCLADGTTLIKKKTGVTTRHSRLNEIVAVVLLAISVLIFLCLILYNQSDPTFNHRFRRRRSRTGSASLVRISPRLCSRQSGSSHTFFRHCLR
jgi:hypothetical protein